MNEVIPGLRCQNILYLGVVADRYEINNCGGDISGLLGETGGNDAPSAGLMSNDLIIGAGQPFTNRVFNQFSYALHFQFFH